MEPTNQETANQEPTNQTADAMLRGQEDEHLDFEADLAALKTMDPADSPGRAQAIADHLMRELNSNSMTGDTAAS